jgi:hypothetical protein
VTGFASGVVEIEFTAGVWTDVSAYYDLNSSVEFHPGRPTEFDDVNSTQMTMVLWNDDGRFVPENGGSPYYPNMVEGKRIRWKVKKGGVTYTRFTGWMVDIEPSFPTDNTVGSQVTITAIDSLGLLGQRKLRSNATERALYIARNAGTWCDAYEFPGLPNGILNGGTNYSTDPTPGVGSGNLHATDPPASFGLDPDASIGPVCKITPNNNGDSSHPIVAFQPNPLIVMFMIRMPLDFVGGGARKNLLSIITAAFASRWHLCLEDNGSAGNRLALFDDTFAKITNIMDVPFDSWVHVYFQQNGGTASHLDVWARTYNSGTFGNTNINIDVRSLVYAEISSSNGGKAASSFGSAIAMGVNTPVAEVDLWRNGPAGVTLATRITALQNAVSQLPVSFTTVGSTTSGALATGDWSDRFALPVAQEIIRSGGGVLWARGRDSQALWICSDSVRPATPVATIDVDADAWGAPTLTRSADTRPTRVEVTYPGGLAVALDSAAEAGGQVRSKGITTVCASQSDAQTLAASTLAQATAGMRIKQITVDLTSAVNDLVASLFSEASTISGLFPTCRVRLSNLPMSHFNQPTRDAYVQGWTERYDRNGARLTLDTTPAIPVQQFSDTFTGTTGAALSGSWLAGTTATGGTALINTNRARFSSGTVANGYTARRLVGTLAASDQTLLVRWVASQATARIWARGDSTLAVSGYYVSLDTSGTARLRIMTGGVSTDLATWSFTATTATDYGVRFRVVDKYLLVKTWTGALSAEPGAWSTPAVVDTTYSAAGYNGLGVVGDATTTSRAVDFDTITIMDGA